MFLYGDAGKKMCFQVASTGRKHQLCWRVIAEAHDMRTYHYFLECIKYDNYRFQINQDMTSRVGGRSEFKPL